LADILAVKRKNAAVFAERLTGIDGVTPPAVGPHHFHPYTLYTLLLPPERRHAVAAALDAASIETRIYFPPAHHQPVFAGCASSEQPLPVTESLADRTLSVPFHSRITDDDLAEMATIIGSAVSPH